MILWPGPIKPAGLQCLPAVHIGNQHNLAGHGGRAFVTASDYQVTVEVFVPASKDLLPVILARTSICGAGQLDVF